MLCCESSLRDASNIPLRFRSVRKSGGLNGIDRRDTPKYDREAANPRLTALQTVLSQWSFPEGKSLYSLLPILRYP
jgi:hypothetical protein